ncbi:hypothetical protein SUNI508_05853 [Seiridium unicorne]|uniref:Uncharacterized protein n=1 Tax=Seiridium unicorne TaxID=138068 RepID=A0ABR2V324_9PEZI
MPATDSGFGSNNPFRRNPAGDPSSAAIPTGGSAAPSTSFLDAAPPLTSTPRPPPPFTTFRTAAAGGEDGDARREETIQIKPKKIVKKVRVQSPPPSSPEDSTPVRGYPSNDYSDDSSSSDSHEDVEQIDPFNIGPPPPEPTVIDGEPPLPLPPPNPFSKTLQDLEQNTQDLDGQTDAGAKGALDVDSFKRLLLTGYANIPGPGAQGAAGPNLGSQPATAHDGASNTDASSISRQSIFDAIQETPRTSHEISEPEEATIAPSSPLSNVQPASSRKPPPPPSSRHGKLIKIELGADGKKNKGPPPAISVDTSSPVLTPNRKSSTHSLSQTSPPSSSDINKPLPLPPTRTLGEEDVDSPFDREAAGKLPESFAALTTSPRPPTPPSTTGRPRSESQTSTLTTSSAHRKPAPPPRRHGHGRTESKPPSILSDKAEEDPPRSSLESNRSRADSLRVNVSSDRTLSAPAPPPPRRPNHARQGSSFASPTAASFSHVSSPGTSDESRSPGVVGLNPMEHHNLGAMATVTHSRDGLPKLSPPPPPPKRHSSIRRPSSAHSTDAGSIRRVSREKDGGAPPPPPPPRARGNSKANPASGEVHTTPRRTGTGSAVNTVDEEPMVTTNLGSNAAEPVGGDDIMEQLKALQQEVEAARKASGSG